MLRRYLPTALLALSLSMLASGAVAAPAQQEVAVQAKDFVFDPVTITVAPGTTVVWTNTGLAPHTVTANDDVSYDSGRMDSGDVFSHTYAAPGEYGYYCVFHGSPGQGMAGTVIVAAADAPAEPAAPTEPTEPAPAALPAVSADVTITSPAQNATIAGTDVTVTIDVTGATLVPGAQATQLEDLHVHYLLDVDPTPFLDGGQPFPTGRPDIVHSAALSQTFTNVAPGEHTVTVVLGYSSHQAVQPPVAPSVTFTVLAPAAPAPPPVAPAAPPAVPAAPPTTGQAPGAQAPGVQAPAVQVPKVQAP